MPAAAASGQVAALQFPHRPAGQPLRLLDRFDKWVRFYVPCKFEPGDPAPAFQVTPQFAKMRRRARRRASRKIWYAVRSHYKRYFSKDPLYLPLYRGKRSFGKIGDYGRFSRSKR